MRFFILCLGLMSVHGWASIERVGEKRGEKSKMVFNWSPEERRFYVDRNFIVLEHLLVQNRQKDQALEVQKQERDLPSCKALHRGAGNISTTLQCMSFLNREKNLGLESSSSKNLVSDINILCSKLTEEAGATEKLVKSSVFKAGDIRWTPCLNQVWQQVYLTAYANFDADPVGTLALIRRAEKTLPPEKPWTNKVQTLIHRK